MADVVTSEPGLRYRLTICRKCDGGFAQVARRGHPRTLCIYCRLLRPLAKGIARGLMEGLCPSPSAAVTAPPASASRPRRTRSPRTDATSPATAPVGNLAEVQLPAAAAPEEKAAHTAGNQLETRLPAVTAPGADSGIFPRQVYVPAPRRKVPEPPPAAPLDRTRFRGPCEARCADTGKRCALPFHAVGDHAVGRYRFTAIAAPGQTFFPKAAELEQLAGVHDEPQIPEAASRSGRASYETPHQNPTYPPGPGERACDECGNRTAGGPVCSSECAESRRRRVRFESTTPPSEAALYV